MSKYPYLILETAPASEPLTLTETKNYLRVSGSDEDTLITELIKAVRQAAENFLNSALITQTWNIRFDRYAPSEAKLPFGPVQSVEGVFLIDETGSETELSSSAYRLTAGNDKVQFNVTPVAHQVEVTYVTGYGNSGSDVPSPIKQGMLSHIAAIYEGRSGASALPEQSLQLYSPFRTIRMS